MDRSRKRKAVPGASPESEGNAAKRTKLPQDAETTTRVGLQFIQQLKAAKDKSGRIISTLFLSLPDKDELPDYYEATKLPIAIDTIEDKLQRHVYASLSQVESDLKRMVANAKSYNVDTSEVFADAERIRKMVSNYMSKNNPAYRNNPDYVAVATPIPANEGHHMPTSTAKETPKRAARDVSEQPRKPTVTISLKNRKSSVAAASPTATEETAANTPAPTGDYSNKTFQQAQEQMINELIHHVVDDVAIFQPFVNLPSRSMQDYYQVIKKPMSLMALKKKTRGQHGRDKPTGVSDFKTWDALEEEVAYIWNNARTYNEDGSEMFELAGEFEQYFRQRLALAKQQVEGLQQPKITLKTRPKQVLHLGAKPSPAPAPGVSVDNDALARQKQAVQVGMNGHQTPVPHRPSLPPTRSTSQVPAATPAPVKRTQSGQPSSPLLATTAVKSEKSVAPSPAPTPRVQSTAPEARQPSQTAASMPPPGMPSGSPRPPVTPFQAPQVPAYVPAPTTFIDHFSRTKPVTEALLPNVTITTHPQQPLPKQFKLDIPPSPAFTQQSLTINLPASHFYIQIAPTVSPQILSGRQYKLFVTVNGTRLMASNKPFLNGDMNGVLAPRQVYETILAHGVNRIEVEIVAVTGNKGGALETEKISVYANLMRA